MKLNLTEQGTCIHCKNYLMRVLQQMEEEQCDVTASIDTDNKLGYTMEREINNNFKESQILKIDYMDLRMLIFQITMTRLQNLQWLNVEMLSIIRKLPN